MTVTYYLEIHLNANYNSIFGEIYTHKSHCTTLTELGRYIYSYMKTIFNPYYLYVYIGMKTIF